MNTLIYWTISIIVFTTKQSQDLKKITKRHSTIDHVITQKSRNDFLTLTSNKIITEGFSDHQIIIARVWKKSGKH